MYANHAMSINKAVGTLRDQSAECPTIYEQLSSAAFRQIIVKGNIGPIQPSAGLKMCHAT